MTGERKREPLWALPKDIRGKKSYDACKGTP